MLLLVKLQAASFLDIMLSYYEDELIRDHLQILLLILSEFIIHKLIHLNLLHIRSEVWGRFLKVS